jgi:hypothetical protein
MRVRLMPDYQCFPLWLDEPNEVGNIDPRDLQISSDLMDALQAWASRYDATLNKDDPTNSGFSSVIEEEFFLDEGRRLSARLTEQLGYEVRYFYDG